MMPKETTLSPASLQDKLAALIETSRLALAAIAAEDTDLLLKLLQRRQTQLSALPKAAAPLKLTAATRRQKETLLELDDELLHQADKLKEKQRQGLITTHHERVIFDHYGQEKTDAKPVLDRKE